MKKTAMIFYKYITELIQQIKKVGFIKTATSIQTVWDVKSWLEPTMAGCHNFNDCFHIQIHYNEGNIPYSIKRLDTFTKQLLILISEVFSRIF